MDPIPQNCQLGQSDIEYGLGCGLGALLNSALPAVPVFVLMTTYVSGSIVHALIVFILSWLLGTLFGFWLGNFATDRTKLGAIANILYHLLIMLPPVYYPLELYKSIFIIFYLLYGTAQVEVHSDLLLHLFPHREGKIILSSILFFECTMIQFIIGVDLHTISSLAGRLAAYGYPIICDVTSAALFATSDFSRLKCLLMGTTTSISLCMSQHSIRMFQFLLSP